MTDRAPFTFQGTECWTGIELMELLALISDQDEADEFMVAYSELFDTDEDAIQSVRYYVQIIAYDPDDETGEIREEMQRVCEMLGARFPSAGETIPPQHTFGNSSYGVKVTA